ncbi:MAG: hypothetical protein HUK07_01680, partial [Bacteroidaceae bacterium]|nr:hypothetical protein [Bacteroidaceae bacterium]
MKKIIFGLTLATSMAFIASCSNETMNDSAASEATAQCGMKEISLITSNPDGGSQSRHALERDGDNLKKTKWEAGDTISLVYNMDNSGSTTKWQAVNLVYTETVEDNHRFTGKIPENYNGTFLAVYPALDSRDGKPSLNKEYTFDAKSKFTDSNGKLAIHKYFESVISERTTKQKQVGNNNSDHLAKLDYMIADQEIQCNNNDGVITLTKGDKHVVWKHAFTFYRIFASARSMRKGTYTYSFNIWGLWSNADSELKANPSFTVDLEGFNEAINKNEDLVIWMVAPSAKVPAGTKVCAFFTSLNTQEGFDINTQQEQRDMAKETEYHSGVFDEGSFTIYNLDFRKTEPEHHQIFGMFYAWGNLDGYDVRKDDHWYTNNNNGFKNCSNREVEQYLPGYTKGWNGEPNCWAGLYNPTPLNIKPQGQDPHDLKPFAQPLGVGDPVAYQTNGKMHVPSSREMNALLCLQGDIWWDRNCNPNPARINALPGRRDQQQLRQLAQCVSKELSKNPVFNNVNGHKTGFWVAEDAKGQPHLNWSCNQNGQIIAGWRLYPSNAKSLDDEYILLPMIGTSFYEPLKNAYWNINETRFWTSSS